MSGFVWFEAYVEELATARRHLAVIPGWTLADRPGPVPYVTIRAGEDAIGGLMPIPPSAEAEPHWVAHVAVDDVGALCRRVAFVQGEVLLEPTELDGVGTTALVEDPVGAVLAPFAFLGHAPHPAAGALRFATLLAPRRDLGARVYRTLLDWRELASVDTDAGRLTVLHDPLGGHAGAPGGEAPIGALLDAGEVAGAQWVPHVPVDDPAAVLAAIEADGGDVLLPPTDVDGVGTIALAVLADGLPLGLIRR